MQSLSIDTAVDPAMVSCILRNLNIGFLLGPSKRHFVIYTPIEISKITSNSFDSQVAT